MTRIYHTAEFSLSQAVLDHLIALQTEFTARFPDDSAMLAGISLVHPVNKPRPISECVLVGCWLQSEVSQEALKEATVIELAGFRILFDVPEEHRPIFRNNVIDFARDKGFFLRPDDSGET
jgi:hypothetical protein